MPLLHTWTAGELIPMYPDFPHPQINVKFGNNLTLAAGTVVGETATDGTWGAYADTTATDPAKGLLKYSITTDGSGNITIGSGGAGNEFGVEQLTCPVYVGGAFKTTELTGLDAAAVTNLAGHYISGDLADGVLVF